MIARTGADANFIFIIDKKITLLHGYVRYNHNPHVIMPPSHPQSITIEILLELSADDIFKKVTP